MKKIIIFLLLLTFITGAFAKQPTTKELQKEISAKEAVIQELQDSLMAIPDSTCVTIKDSTFCLPIKDVQVLVDDISTEIKKQGWPKDIMGWFVLIFGLLTGIEGTRRITAGKKIYATLKPVLKSRLGLAVLIAALLSATITFLVGSFEEFNWNIFLVTWPWLALGASFIYERFFKEKK
jgi:hypothetical protein